MEKIRLDKLMVERGLVPSRARAVALIHEGGVLVGGEVVRDAACNVSREVHIELLKEDIPWVSRAGLKLDHALTHWNISAEGTTCLDVGASTGGFTQVLISRGAKLVFAVDVGTNQLAPLLRSDPRIISMEQTHILELPHSKIPRVDLAVVDVSFISLTKIIPHVTQFIKTGGGIVALIKPQFEVGKDVIDQNKGVVRDATLQEKIVDDIKTQFERCGLHVIGTTDSPIEGGDGNKEFLIYATH